MSVGRKAELASLLVQTAEKLPYLPCYCTESVLSRPPRKEAVLGTVSAQSIPLHTLV